MKKRRKYVKETQSTEITAINILLYNLLSENCNCNDFNFKYVTI